MEKFMSSYGECEISSNSERIQVSFPDEMGVMADEDRDASFSKAEEVMQEYCDQNPQGGKFGNNEVQRCEYFSGVYVSEIY